MKNKKIISTHLRLSEKDKQAIILLIRVQEPNLKLTWRKIEQLSEDATGHEFSRQALSADEDIASAYSDKRNEHLKFRAGGVGLRPSPERDDSGSTKIARLEEEVARLKGTIDAQAELLVRFIGNALLAGLSQERLEAPLTPRQQARTDVDAMVDRTRDAQRRSRRLGNR